VEWLVPGLEVDLALMAIVGMSATLGAVVRAPVTSILIVFEMTHQFALVPPLMLTALVSQAISRRMQKRNLYDELLAQDGHDLDRFTPPRDLKSWQAQPVSRLATKNVVCATSLAADDLKQLLARHPYDRFPLMAEGKLAGILRREDIEEALQESAVPPVLKATVCRPEISLRAAESLLVEDETGALVLQTSPESPVEGLLTLHDVLRAEQAAADRAE
jgi:CIC family chloride channel protein